MTLYPWHQDTWQALRGKLRGQGHALLLHGESGTGKWAFIEQLASALLCEQLTDEGFACGQCQNCHWLNSDNHPDYHLLIAPAQRPLWGLEEIEVEGKKADEKKKPSKDIDIAQVRALVNSLYVSPHTKQGRVIVVAPVEAMNVYAANALLKILEEPPSNTIFLLLSHQIHHLLPTIISRCTQLPLRGPSKEEAFTWLEQLGLNAHSDLLTAEGFRPLALQQRLARDPDYSSFLARLLNVLAHPESVQILDMAAEIAKYELIDTVQVVQKWLTDLCLLRDAASLRYFPRQEKVLAQLVQRTENTRLDLFLRELTELRKMSEHTLSPRLFIENLLLRYQRVFT